MTATSNGITKRFIAAFMALLMVVMVIPFTASPVSGTVVNQGYINSAADHSTMDGWKQFFGSSVPNTYNVGKIWTDKSVVATGDDSFTVYLSALASNKEIKGYSTLPTDTMFVLDLSGSMVNQNAVGDLVDAANASITQLLALNKHNRIGVVVYSYQVTTLLPLARYDSTATATVNGETVKVFLEKSNDANVHTKTGVFYEASGTPVTYQYAPQGGGTYIQGGVLAAYDQFNRDEISPEIPDGEIQAGTNRTPIFVLMTDGAPTFCTDWYATSSSPYRYGNGNYERNAGVAFLTQLSNSYAYKQVWDKYKVEPLFYTLGMKVDDNDYAKAVLDPTGNVAEINNYWEQYVAPHGSNAYDEGEWNSQMQITVHKPYGNADGTTQNIVIQRRHNGFALSYTEWLKDYVTKYYSADSASDLINSFKNIVDEIKVQSRYYPTAVESGSNPNIDGYVSFTDVLGAGMKVSQVKGLYLGGKLYTGKTLSDQIGSNVGTVQNPTDLGNEFIWSVQARLGLDLTTARNLVASAYQSGQLVYSDSDPSCYIGWYADANGQFLGHWYDGIQTVPAGATQIIRSYGFLGDTTGSIKGSNMMYVSVRVVEDISSGNQTVKFDIPAALVPMVTYEITVDGKNYSTANAYMYIIEEEPIRLAFDVKLDSSINEFNVKLSNGTVDENGNYQFWSNQTNGISVTYEPSIRNEYYYFVEDADVVWFNSNTQQFERIYGVEALTSPAYRYKEYIFSYENGQTNIVPTYTYVNMEKVIHAGYAKNDRIDPNVGVDYWYIPAGTAHHETDAPADINKTENISKTTEFVHKTNSVTNGIVSETLGNNGLITVTPAQGVRITKAILQGYDPNADTKFEFQITLKSPDGKSLDGVYNALIADAWQYEGVATTVNAVNNVITVNVEAGKSLYIIGLPEGTEYVVRENHEKNYDYTFDYAEINDYTCVIDDANASISGTIDKNKVDGFNFYNIPVSYGALIINKQVVHPYGEDFEIPEGLEFDLEVILEGERLETAFEVISSNGTTENMTPVNGKLNLTIKDGETISIYGLPEGTRYTVNEINLPDGFALGRNSMGLTGVISDTVNSTANLINNYLPNPVSVTIDVNVNKTLTGKDFVDGETYNFALYDENGVLVEQIAVEAKDGALKGGFATIQRTFNKVGEYKYKVVEIDDSANDNGVPGVTYDTTENYFTVKVTDDMGGYLKAEITAQNPAVANGNVVETYFNNTYKATEDTQITININKEIAFPTGATYGLDGFEFELKLPDGVVMNATTDENGEAQFGVTFTPDDIGETFELVLKEINTGISGMIYDETPRTITVKVIDNFDGTIGTIINNEETDTYTAEYENTYIPGVASATISGNKVLDGRDLAEGEFNFVLTDEQGNVYSVSNAADGSFAFSALTFDKVGTYTYTVTEVIGDLGGVTYDESVYTVTINVIDGGNGDLVAEVSIVLDNETVNEIQFVNEYNSVSVEVELDGNKVLNGKDLAENDFEFVLTDKDGNVIETVKNDKDGKFIFTALEFNAVAEYIYTVTEKVGSLGGITYDESVYTVTITVTDDQIGNLVADVTITLDSETVDEIQFVNQYNASPVDVVIDGNKVLNGKDLAENDFEFVLTDREGNEIETVKNDNDGKFVFSAISFDAVGEYFYTVTEKDGSLGGITYDKSVYTVTIKVTDDQNGNLVAEVVVTLNGETVDEIQFVNQYDANSVGVVIDGNKVLTGKDLAEGQFEFVLTDKDGNVIETVKNDQNGRFAFELINFDTVSEYIYTVYEIDSKEIGITYDKSVYTVTITVTDNSQGELVAQVEIEKDGESAEEIVFNNAYAPVEIQVVIDINKVVENKTETEIGADGFEFILSQDGVAIDETISDKDGKASFVLNFTDKDINKGFVYAVYEVNGGMPGMVYSEAIYEYVITIVEENGELKANVTKNGASDDLTAEFVNIFEGIPETGDNTNNLVWVVMLAICSGAVISMFKRNKKSQLI